MPTFLLALGGALVPSLGWLAFFYTRDRYDREPKALILKLFLIGALPVAFVAGLVNSLLLAAIAGAASGGTLQERMVLALPLFAVVVAPIVEETLKYGGTSRGSRRHRAFDEPVDGMVYGTTVGLGFAAAETVDYLVGAYLGVGPLGTPIDFCSAGLECFLVTAFLRGAGSALLHATASGIAGHFLSKRVLGRRGRGWAVTGVGLAIVVHGLWNALSFLALPLPLLLYALLFRSDLRRSPYREAALQRSRTAGLR